MKELVTVAIAKALPPQGKIVKAARDAIKPGRHSLNELIRLNGELVVSEDTKSEPTASLMSVDFLLLVLHRSGVTRDSAMKAITEVAGDYLVNWTGSKEDKKKAKDARKELLEQYDPEGKGKKIFGELTSGLPKIPKKGAVKFEGTIDVVKVSQNDSQILEVLEDIA